MKGRKAGAALAALLLAAGCSTGAPGGSAVPASGSTIQVGSTMDLAPLDFVDEQGNPTGFELDLVKAVSDDLGYKVEYVKTPFEQAFTGLQANKYRFNASAIYARCARVKDKAQYGEFTVPVGQSGIAVTTTVDAADGIKSFEDLEGKTLGVESAGSTSDAIADEEAGAGFKKEIFPDTNSLFLALEQGRIDAAMQSDDVTLYTIRDKPSVTVAFTVEEYTRPYAWIFRADDPLRDSYNASIDKLKADGTFNTIYKKWFGTDAPADHPSVAKLPVVTEETCLE